MAETKTNTSIETSPLGRALEAVALFLHQASNTVLKAAQRKHWVDDTAGRDHFRREARAAYRLSQPDVLMIAVERAAAALATADGYTWPTCAERLPTDMMPGQLEAATAAVRQRYMMRANGAVHAALSYLRENDASEDRAQQCLNIQQLRALDRARLELWQTILDTHRRPATVSELMRRHRDN